jgi:hypothetical protein
MILAPHLFSPRHISAAAPQPNVEPSWRAAARLDVADGQSGR